MKQILVTFRKNRLHGHHSRGMTGSLPVSRALRPTLHVTLFVKRMSLVVALVERQWCSIQVVSEGRNGGPGGSDSPRLNHFLSNSLFPTAPRKRAQQQ